MAAKSDDSEQQKPFNDAESTDSKEVLNDESVSDQSEASEAPESSDDPTDKKFITINNCLIILIIVMLILMLGERYLIRKENYDISVFHEIAMEASDAETTAEEQSTADETALVVNINTADKDELMLLPGIGAAKAQLILDYRLIYGDFQSIEDIMNIKGIGEGIFNKIKDYITV